MNERIQELIARAEMYADEQNKLYGVSYSQTLNEKLAELIVRECMDVILTWESEPFPLDPKYGAQMIAEHFGVQR